MYDTLLPIAIYGILYFSYINEIFILGIFLTFVIIVFDIARKSQMSYDNDVYDSALRNLRSAIILHTILMILYAHTKLEWIVYLSIFFVFCVMFMVVIYLESKLHQRQAMRRLRYIRVTPFNEDVERECCICISDINKDEISFGCEQCHQFIHGDCLSRGLPNLTKCPTCRHPIPTHRTTVRDDSRS